MSMNHQAVNRSRRAVVGVLFAVLVATGLTGCGGNADATTLTLEPVNTETANPFMANIGTDQAGITPPADVGGSVETTTPGLYGGTLTTGSCDAEKMTAFLEVNPDKGAAWARTLGIKQNEIRSYIKTLTSVILRSDTAVTNHGFANGNSTAIPAVLQAGTAVFIDSSGAPVAKCYCGNPLTPPTTKNVVYRGPKWPNFKEGNVTIPDPPATDTPACSDNVASNRPCNPGWVVVPCEDSASLPVPCNPGESFRRPLGTNGSEDVPCSSLAGTPTDCGRTYRATGNTTTTTTTDDDVLVATSNATSTGTEGLCAGVESPIGVRLERLGGAGNSRYYRVTFETTPPVSVLVAMEDGLGGINLNQPVEIGGVTANVTVRGTIKINGDVSATSTSEVAGQTCVSTITGQGVRASR
ncbi:MAG: hypothetical protein F2861_00995 [Actinobacteria bacterium]|nr:hypothetical protein [Actinomycetota bacterium]